MAKMKVTTHYLENPEYEYETYLERLNLDDERRRDLSRDKGFVVTEPQSIKKDLKSPYSPFSSKFGQTLNDVNPYANRYKCECGNITSRLYLGITCPNCGTKVRYVGDDFEYFGWICIKDPYYIIHPNLFKSLQFLIGTTRLEAIIRPIDEKDEDGNDITPPEPPKDNPYQGLGMMGFVDKFDEILNFFYTKNPGKKDYYDDIVKNRDKIFTQSIPVYTTHLRPFKVDGSSLFFEGVNANYNMLAKLAALVNKDQLNIFRKKKSKNQALYDMQTQYNEIYAECERILAQKKGSVRMLFGGRYNFSARSVIVPDQKLRIDQVRLPYHALCELLQQSIINILQKTHSILYSDAYKIWYKAQITHSQIVEDIIKGIIDSYPNGIPILLNRNPTISYGGIMLMHVVGINMNYTTSVPLRILKPLAADFDGDTQNIMYHLNKDFIEAAERVMNPRNAMQISRNDGMFNDNVNHAKDVLINCNSMIQLSRDKYSAKQLEMIKKLQR